MNDDLMKAVSGLHQLERFIENIQNKTSPEEEVEDAQLLRQKTEDVSQELQQIVDALKEERLSLSKDEIILLMSSIEQTFSLLSKEVTVIKNKIRKTQIGSKIHKGYSGQ